MSSGSQTDTVYIEPSLVVLQPAQASVSGSSYIDSDSEDDITMSSTDAAHRAAQGRLLGISNVMDSGSKSLSRDSNPSVTLEEVDCSDDEDDVHSRLGYYFGAPRRAAKQAEEFVKKVWEAGWRVVHHNSLPNWLKDNDFLHKGHRTPTNSFTACFKSIFRIHTETGNIWTHLLGFIAFIGIAAYFVTRPSLEVQWQEKVVFSAFFLGAILCLGFSWVFHTVFNHSKKIGKLFNKLDYCGIAFLEMGSFVPYLYYSFYCRLGVKITYVACIICLGTLCLVVSLWDKFSEPRFRALRAGVFIALGLRGVIPALHLVIADGFWFAIEKASLGWLSLMAVLYMSRLMGKPTICICENKGADQLRGVFIALGLSGVIPALHLVIADGFWFAIEKASLGWLSLMAVLYITGAVIYAVRIPERLFPGKFDIWFQSHQIFHVFVLAAAFVHYHGISELANFRLTLGDCIEPTYF